MSKHISSLIDFVPKIIRMGLRFLQVKKYFSEKVISLVEKHSPYNKKNDLERLANPSEPLF